MADALGARQAAILRAIVREFVTTGEPVGSKHLVEHSGLDVSSATVRNEMARLEELGYLAQPHTSAGRVPTDLGYRFVVDQITRPRPLGQGQRRMIENELIGPDPLGIDVDEMLRRASDVVSRFTRHAAAILAQRARASRLRRLELVPVGGRSVSVIAIAENGRVEQRMVGLDVELMPARVEAIARTLNDELGGRQLEDAIRAVGARTPPDNERPLCDAVVTALRALLASDSHVFVNGAANLAGEDAFERETLSRLYEALERQTAVLELLASALDDPISVRIGSELPSEEFQRCSVVVARFETGADGTGSVGIIGPTRMDYERVIATADSVARVIERSINAADRS